MQLEFIPVEAFYFALTLAVRPLEDLENPDLVEQVRSRLEQECGQPQSLPPNKIHLTMYFAFMDTTTALHPSSLVSVADWQDNLRLVATMVGSWIRSVSQFVRNVSASARSLPKNCGHTSKTGCKSLELLETSYF